jgi:hypothetical protein
MKNLGAAGLAIAGLLITSSVASAQVLCVLPLMFSAAQVYATEHRELTNREATWCGLVRDTQTVTVKKVKKKKVARREKKQ